MNRPWLLAGLLLTSPVRAEIFSCASSHPEFWGTLTVHIDRQLNAVTIEGDQLPGAKLAFVDGMFGPVEIGSSDLNSFGTEVGTQFVRFWGDDILVGWRNGSGEIEYSAMISRSVGGRCALKPLCGAHTG